MVLREHPPAPHLVSAIELFLREANREGGAEGGRAAAAALFGAKTHAPVGTGKPGNVLAVRTGKK